MYDDPSLYAFVPSAHSTKPAAKHGRTPSLLEPQDSQANDALGESHALEALKEEPSGPPEATLSRRAQSYTDFHHAVRAVLGQQETEASKRSRRRRKSIEVGHTAGKKQGDVPFDKWYEELEGALMDAGQDEYSVYLEELKFAESYLQSLTTSTDRALEDLGALSQSFRDVEIQTSVVRKQCHDLITEQRRLDTLADDIKENLKYYSYLEPITRRLNAPGAGSFVRGKEFSDMLARLDECLEYMNSHPNQKEASNYRSRYRLLMTRGLTLIKVHFTAALQEISQDVNKRIAEKQLNETTMSTLLYAKFRVGATELKELAHEIQARTILPPGAEAGAESEYQGLMNELYQGYATTRGRLVMPLIQKKINDLSIAPNAADNLVIFARSSIVYVKGMCQDEWDLWREWFSGQAGVYDHLESVCEPLYDYLRPRIIHETQLLRLCELCTLLQTRYFREEDDETEPIDPHKFDFGPLIQPALEDAQTRLVFRALAILRDDVERYKPKNEDLDYPARLKASLSGKKSNGPVTSGRKNSITEEMLKDPVTLDDLGGANGGFVFGAETSMHGWFPTLRKCIWLLSRIYRLVNSTVFDDLAHNIVHQTTLSLQRASVQISGKASALDGQLFLLKHLLLLKQQIVAFDIEFVTPDISVDFSGVTSTFWELRQRGSLLDPRAIWNSLSQGSGLLPRVVENMLDAKAELDGALRAVISDIVTTQATSITSSLASQPGAPTAGQPPKTGKSTFDSAGAVRATCAAGEAQVPVLRAKLDAYIGDARTRETLVYAVQEQVVQDYDGFHDRYAADCRARGAPPPNSRKGKAREGQDVMGDDAFADWAATTFGVRTAVLDAGANSSAPATPALHQGRPRRLSGGSGSLGLDDDDEEDEELNGDAASIPSV